MKLLLGSLLCLMLSAGVQAKDWDGMSIFNLKSQWHTHKGDKILLADMADKITVFAMAYTSCQHTCPMIMAKLKKIEVDLPAKIQKKVRFAVISFDPERDTVEHLRKYHVQRKLSDSWLLITGKNTGVRELAAAIGVNYKKEKDGEFSHSNVITLIDTEGVVREQLMSLSDDESKIVNKVKNILK